MKSIYYQNNHYNEFETPDEYYKWFKTTYSTEYINSIYNIPESIENLNSILYYQGNGYLRINKFLREYSQQNNKTINNLLLYKAKEIQNFINKNAINENIIVYRFVGQKEYNSLIKHKRKIKTIKQFLSTTATPKFCSDKRYVSNFIIKILINKDSNVIAYTDFNKKHVECEILLPYNSQLKFLCYDKEKIPVFQQSYTLTRL